MKKNITIIAGEPSGDFLGAQLAHALKTADSSVSLSGVGGPLMNAQGVQSLFPYEELSVMGIAEVLPNLPNLLKRIRQTINFIKETKPDIVVTIDSPDFCFRVAKAVRKEMDNPPKLIHYVAPSVWAWRAGRAKKIADFLDGLICLFDFEPPFFEGYDLRSVAVGHPLVESGALQASGAKFRDENGMSKQESVIGVLFGSRKGELKRVGPTLRDAAFKLSDKIGGNVSIVAPTLPHLKNDVFNLLKDYRGQIHITTNPDEKWEAFASMDVAMATSGTVGLELAAMKVPHVIAYKVNPLTWWMVRLLVKVRFAHLANIMTDDMIVLEFLQNNCEPNKIMEQALMLMVDASDQKDAFDSIRFRIGADQKETPSQKAAAFVLSF
jgi:lipid-A-disaccharide synthase